MLYPVISIRQPWAWAILHAGKDVENRTWNIPRKYLNRPVLIHAGRSLDKEGYIFLENFEACPLIEMPMGGIVGACIFAGENIRSRMFSPWRAEGQNQWAIERAWSVPFHPCRGQLGFFQVDYPHDVNIPKDGMACR